MAVLVRKKRLIIGKEKELTTYLPEGVFPTTQLQKKADLLDQEIRASASEINREFENLPNHIQKNEIEKWNWLGEKLDFSIKHFKNIDKSDLDKHAIWPGINQYLRKELKRGFETKRSGTSKDHLRKCWLFYVSGSRDWFNSWTGWDAFVDRGEQFAANPRILKSLKKYFPVVTYKLTKNKYQMIAKYLVKILSSKKGRAINIGALSDSEIDDAVKLVKNSFIS